MTEISPKQRRFVDEYLVDMDATKAAIRAGYSPRTADVQGSRFLSHGKVAEAIQAAKLNLATRVGITQEMVVAEYAKIGFSNILDFIKVGADGSAEIDLTRMTRDQAAAIGEITSEVYTERSGDDGERVKRTKFKLIDKKGALDSLARHLGMFVDKSTVEVNHTHTHEHILRGANERALARLQSVRPLVIENDPNE